MSKVTTMQSKIDALSAPAAVATSSAFMLIDTIVDGLPDIALFLNVILAFFGILVMFSKWRISRLEYKKMKLEFQKEEASDV